jgi:hypothetical protein
MPVNYCFIGILFDFELISREGDGDKAADHGKDIGRS